MANMLLRRCCTRFLNKQKSQYLFNLESTMKHRSLFLTGGTGFFGKSILQWLLENPLDFLDLTILSRHPQAFLDANPQFQDLRNLSFVQGDIRSFAFPRTTFDAILHAATPADANLEREHPDEMYSIIVDGTHHVLDLAMQCGCKRFLMTSSGGVYGVQPPELSHLSESFPCQPVSAYGRGKHEAERLCVIAAAKHNFTALLPRCFSFVGPYLPLDAHFAIGNFINDCLKNRPIMIQGDGTPLRSYLYADDLVEWLLKILVHGAHGHTYNVGSEEAISIRDLAYLVQRCTGATNEVILQQTTEHTQLPERYVPSTERIRHDLGVTQTVGLEEAIRRTFTYHQKKESA